jgi:outer membrane protein assembly factor BamE (lipoprotein component of BamABCDE complex)
MGATMMKSFAVKLSAFFLIVLLSGCAGTNFVRINDDALILGQTTPEQISARLGKPYQEGTAIKHEQQIKSAAYAYASTGGEGAAEGVVAARSQGFYFFNDKLVGYEFISSWKEDSTNFDNSKISQIKKGESTRSDVVRLLGNPGGRAIYPIIPNSNEEAINYVYSQTKGSAFNLKFYQKQLVVTFNKNGVVTDVEFTESGTP